MDWWLLTFFLGAILSLFLPEVPALFPLFLLLCLAIGFYYVKPLRCSTGLWFGALWILAQAYLYHSQLPDNFLDLMQKKQTFWVTGKVLSMHVKPEGETSINTRISTTKNPVELTKRFNFLVSKVNQQSIEKPIVIRLSWKRSSVDITQGQKMLLNVKLKPVHGLANIGTFNYLSWLKANNISATGYVVNPRKNKNKSNNLQLKEQERVKGATVLKKNKVLQSSSTVRQQLFDDYHSLVPDHELKPILLALAFGERSLLNPAHWKVLQATGTSHLIAISGLHVGLLASSAFFIVVLLSQYLPLKNARWQQCNIRYIAIVVSLLFATIYAYLAGFSLPTQRALVMLNLYWFSRLVGIKLSAKRLILITLFVLLIISPFSLLTASFWLSFYAVAIIFVTLWRFKSWLHNGSAFWRFCKGIFIIQVALTLMLMPITALFFQQISLLSFAANIVAVPWMSIVSIPTALISVLLMPFSDQLSQLSMLISLQSLSWLWYYLELLSMQDNAIISVSWIQQLSVLAIGITVFLICYLSSLRLSTRVKFGILFLLFTTLVSCFLVWLYLTQYFVSNALLLNDKTIHIQKRLSNKKEATINVKRTKKNNMTDQINHKFTPWQVVFFDVGQGLSILLKRNNHAILYDTGAAYPSGFSMSEAVILPYLKYSGIEKLDKVILSHSDNDHAGGIDRLINNIAIDEVISNDKGIIQANISKVSHLVGQSKEISNHPLMHKNVVQKRCDSNQNFSWQRLTFTILWPLESTVLTGKEKRIKQKNDDSCVILITDINGRKLLLTGDISAKVEQQLLTLYPQLTVNILQVPHHGSKTSSSNSFLSQLSPEIALVSAGYLNRWNMPVNTVIQRYRELDIQLLNSAEVGQIIMTFNDDGIKKQSYVDDLRPFWFSH